MHFSTLSALWSSKKSLVQRLMGEIPAETGSWTNTKFQLAMAIKTTYFWCRDQWNDHVDIPRFCLIVTSYHLHWLSIHPHVISRWTNSYPICYPMGIWITGYNWMDHPVCFWSTIMNYPNNNNIPELLSRLLLLGLHWSIFKNPVLHGSCNGHHGTTVFFSTSQGMYGIRD